MMLPPLEPMGTWGVSTGIDGEWAFSTKMLDLIAVGAPVLLFITGGSGDFRALKDEEVVTGCLITYRKKTIMRYLYGLCKELRF